MPEIGKPHFFATPAEWRQWLKKNHNKERELWVGFHKKGSGRQSITWPESVDEALCFGWIDGIRKSLGDDAYTIRFTPRRKGSIWSRVNVERFNALKLAGLMTAEGERAYEENKHKSGLYAYEREAATLAPDEEARFRKVEAAWTDWEARPAGYRKTVLHWITSAKRPETRSSRLAALIDCSAAGTKIPRYDIGRKS